MQSETENLLLSVITVTRNLIDAGREESMRAAIQAVQVQTLREIEHIIFDGASTDGTDALIRGMIAEVVEEHAPIPVRFFTEPDQSLFDAMNKAVGRARGEYVLFLNSDDTLAAPDVLERVFALLGSRRPDYIFGQTIYEDPDGSKRLSRKLSTAGILLQNPFCHNSTLFRRTTFEAIGGHDLRFRLAADYDMLLRLILGRYSGAAVQMPISVFRRGGLSGDSVASGREVVQVWRKNFQQFADMSQYSDAECLEWLRRGQLPLSVSWSILVSNVRDPVVRWAALYSLFRTARRRAQPWRSWDNLGRKAEE